MASLLSLHSSWTAVLCACSLLFGLACCEPHQLVPCSAASSSADHLVACFVGEDYNPLTRPPNNASDGSDAPLQIHTYVQVVDVREVNEHKFYFTLALQMDTSWVDPRLRVLRRDGRTVTESSVNLSVPAELEPALWRPNIYIYDLRLYRSVGSLNADKIHSVSLTPGGRVTVTDRYEVDVTCGFNHSYFPFDRQECPFRYGVLGELLKQDSDVA